MLGRLYRRSGLPGSGTASGRITLLLAPDALEHLTASRNVVVVSGTNGKTTTTRLIAEILAMAAPVATNRSGANMPAGIVTAIIELSRFDHAVFEVDERYLPIVCARTSPTTVVLLNLSRDQLDRNPETTMLAKTWRETLRHLQPHVVANCDDPNIYWAASGSSRVTWVSMGDIWPHDSGWCAACGRPLVRRSVEWSCPGCSLRRPSPDWITDGESVKCLPQARRYDLRLKLPGRVNVANAAMALATASSLGYPAEGMTERLAAVHSVAGRYKVTRFMGQAIRLLLAKNPASWAETLDTINKSTSVVIMLNARELDGHDTSWIWDVDFRRLKGLPVFVGGDRRFDLAVRLDVANVGFRLVSSLDEACALAPTAFLDVVANYTAFLELLVKLRSARQT
jgi:UDP-N-acetylmuramyl tripeptide synthase